MCRGIVHTSIGWVQAFLENCLEEHMKNGLLKGLFEEVLFDTGVKVGLICCKVKEGAGVQILSAGGRRIQRQIGDEKRI